MTSDGKCLAWLLSLERLLKIQSEGLPWWSSGKTLPSNAGGVGLIPGQGAKIPHAARPKTKNKNRSDIVTNSIKT